MSALDGLTAEQVSHSLPVSRSQLEHLARTAPDSYQELVLDVGGKSRELRIPREALKEFQSAFYTHFLRGYPFRDEVYCRPGRGVVDAAKRHRRHPYLLHLDIRRFFPSVHYGLVRSSLREAGVEGDFVPMLTRLLTVDNQLPQGAPTSVAVGNLVLSELDRRLGRLCRDEGLTYTRYVDDLTISGGERLTKYEGTVRNIASSCGWELGEKGGMLGPDDEHFVLGVVIGTELNVSDEYLQDVEEAIRGVEVGEVEPGEALIEKLSGRISWVEAVQPERGGQLRSRLQQAVGDASAARIQDAM